MFKTVVLPLDVGSFIYMICIKIIYSTWNLVLFSSLLRRHERSCNVAKDTAANYRTCPAILTNVW